MKLFMLLGLLMLTSCAPPDGGASNGGGSPASLLIGTWDFPGAEVNFDVSGTFTVLETSPTTCNIAGTYIDASPGEHSGTVTFVNVSGSCSVNHTEVDQYTVANHTLILSK